MGSSKFNFVKDFVESDKQFEDFNKEQLEFFKTQVKELGIEVDDMNEETFYIIKEELINMFSKMQNIIESKESEEIVMGKSANTNNATVNNTTKGGIDMGKVNGANGEVAATEEITMGQKAKELAEASKEKLSNGFKFAVENVEGVAEEVKNMANMKDTELEEYIKENGKSVIDKIVDAVKNFVDDRRKTAEEFSLFADSANKTADKAEGIVALIKQVLDDEGTNGWGKFKAIVKEIAKWLVKLLLKVGAIVLKLAFTIAVGVIKIGATALVTAGRTVGVLNKEVVKPSVDAGKSAWAKHKAKKSEKEAAMDDIEDKLFDDENDFEENDFE